MTTYNTGNSLGSSAAKDLFDNAQNLDYALNSITQAIWKDRFGINRRSYWGMEQAFSAQLFSQDQRFNTFIQNSGYQVIGNYEGGPLTIREYNQLIRYDNELWKITATTTIPFTTTGSNSTSWAVDSIHFVSVGDAALRQNLASSGDGLGDALIGVKQPFTGSAVRTQHDKNAEFVSVTDFLGATQGKNYDSTAAFVSAYATGLPVYVPRGDWYTTVFNRHQTYGDGVVYSNDADSYSDTGSRPIPPHPDNGTQFTTYHATRGNAERAAGRAKIINNPNGRVQVSKFSDPSQYATYVNSDHVGEYRSMYAPRNFVSTIAASTTYTVNSMSSPEIIAGANIQVGDFVNTTHAPRYKAKILEINFSTNTVTVDGWYAAGNQASGQIPVNGFSANINKADKIWGENTVVYLDQFGLTATGYELGFLVSVQQGTPVWGFHAVNYSTTYTLDQAFRATGLWLTGYYVGPGVLRGLRHEVGSNDYTTIRTENTTADNWTGSVIDLQTSFPKSTSHLVKITQGAVTLFSIDSRGQRSTQRESYGVVSASTTLTGLSASEISCINATADTITLTLSSTSCVTGQKFNIRATDGPVIVDGYTLNDANGRFICVMWDGSTFIRRFQTN
ncbi:hypothetical protein JHW33_03375 [Rahnella aceris]|uniref:hypothetical protein n=1 Tax=Rahnella sp. (strain Y9602) TaxID=2703885 RepID=UPI001902D479|nr:hypothetical protein [Rahnella aceris]QQN35700.1 hypothetical protein JHW33_03375 [Rahnella aceris]